MKKLLLVLTLGAQACLVACAAMSAHAVAQRRPLEKTRHEYKTPTSYQPRVRGFDPKTGDPVTYDHKPRVEMLDAKTGRYAFRWVGFDGQEKTATFQTADAVDVTVAATVTKTASGDYLYTYEVKNLPSSGAYLKRFMIQNYAPDVTPEKDGALMPFTMSKDVQGFGEGHWLTFADVSDDVQVDPGQAVQIHLTSSSPPGLVQCRASAQTVVEGADEETPSDLESLMPGFDEYPHGFTVGPVERLKGLSADERTQYLLEHLPQFRKLGWITDGAASRYEEELKTGGVGAVSGRAEADLKAEQITPEVFEVIKAIS